MSAQVPEKFQVNDAVGHVEVVGVSKARVQDALRLLDYADEIRTAASNNLRSVVNQSMVQANMPAVPETTQRQIQRTAALNEELLNSGYETHGSLAELRQASPSSTRTWVARHRKDHRLFTVKLHGKILIPSAQLTGDGALREEVVALVKPLSKAGLNGWSLWAWLNKPTGLLSGGVPSEVATTNLKRARRAADRYAAEIRLAKANAA